MTRLLLVAAVAAAAGTTARAQAPVVPLSGTSAPTASIPAHMLPEPVATPEEVVSQRYGLLPWLRRGFSGKSNYGTCAGCEAPAKASRLAGLFGGRGDGGHFGHGGGGGGYGGAPGAGVPGVPQQGQPGMGMPGTLAFPVNPYIRSPRDFFMTPPGR